jgi:hypothetical protein
MQVLPFRQQRACSPYYPQAALRLPAVKGRGTRPLPERQDSIVFQEISFVYIHTVFLVLSS